VNSDVRYFAGLVGLPFYFYFGDFYLFFKAAMDTFFLVLVACNSDIGIALMYHEACMKESFD
jgi:hypothetical protein